MRSTIMAVLLFASACSSPLEPPAPFDAEVRVSSDDGTPVEGARVSSRGGASRQTDHTGQARLRLDGREGDRVELMVECPTGYERTNTQASLLLAHARSVQGEPLPALHAELVCERTTRDVVVLVDAPGAASIPVHVQGITAAATDSNGSAHIVLSVSRAVRTLQVSLDTTHAQNVVPRMPSRTFELGKGDNILLYQQAFAPVTTPRPPRTKPRQRHRGPTRID